MPIPADLTRFAGLACLAGALAIAAPAHGEDQGEAAKADRAALEEAASDARRPDGDVARDQYRQPVEVLGFFDIAPDATVVEIWPGGGYYAQILAPYLKQGGGTYYAAGFPRTAEGDFATRSRDRFAAFLAADPERFDEVITTGFGTVAGADDYEIAPAGSVDAVLTFRNLHNWMAFGFVDKGFEAFYAALKPGGILGIVEHEAPADGMQDPMAESGYVQRAWTVAKAVEHGFEYVGASEVLDNPADTKDHPEGVWTLPPTLRTKVDGCEGPTFAQPPADQPDLECVDQAAYLEIGESDRYVLKFRKPAEESAPESDTEEASEE